MDEPWSDLVVLYLQALSSNKDKDVYGRTNVHVRNYCRCHDRPGCIIICIGWGRRSKGMKATIQGHDEGDKGRKVKLMIRMANPFKIKMHYGNN